MDKKQFLIKVKFFFIPNKNPFFTEQISISNRAINSHPLCNCKNTLQKSDFWLFWSQNSHFWQPFFEIWRHSNDSRPLALTGSQSIPISHPPSCNWNPVQEGPFALQYMLHSKSFKTSGIWYEKKTINTSIYLCTVLKLLPIWYFLLFSILTRDELQFFELRFVNGLERQNLRHKFSMSTWQMMENCRQCNKNWKCYGDKSKEKWMTFICVRKLFPE